MQSAGVNTLLTVGITTHINTDIYKFKIMLKSLFSPQSKSSYFFNSHKVKELKGLMQTHIRNGYYYESFANEYVETIINVDMKCTEAVDIRTNALGMINNRADNIFSNVIEEYDLNNTLSADTINTLSIKVLPVLESIYTYIPERARKHTSITFTINNSSIGRVSRCRNNIIRNASGKFITFRDDDDMSVNINEIATFISAADYFKNKPHLNIMDVQEYFYNKDGSNRKRPKRARKANTSEAAQYPYQYKLPYQKLLDSEIVFIEAALMKCTSNFHSRSPIYTTYYLTNCIIAVDFLRNYDLYFNENTVAEDSFWRFDIYRRLFLNNIDSNCIKLIPRPVYAIYEKTFSTTDNSRDKDGYYEMVSAVMDNLHKKYDRIPMLMDQFNMCAMLIEKEFRVRSLVKYMLNRNNFNKFTFSNCLRMIAEHNVKRMNDGDSLEKYIEVPHKVWNIFRKEYKFDKYSMFMHPRLRNKFGINKFFMHEENYDCNSTTCNMSNDMEFFNNINVGGENAYDRYVEDCTVAENEHSINTEMDYAESDVGVKDRSEKRYKCLFVPTLLLLWMEQVKLKHVRRELLEWMNNKNNKENARRKLISELIIEYSSESSSSDEFETEKDEGISAEKDIKETDINTSTTENISPETDAENVSAENKSQEMGSAEIVSQEMSSAESNSVENTTVENTTAEMYPVEIKPARTKTLNRCVLVQSLLDLIILLYILYYYISKRVM